MKNIMKISMPIAIIISSIILGGVYYISWIEEREQDKKKYIVKRKDDCYKIQNNTSSSDYYIYNETQDICIIIYSVKITSNSVKSLKKRCAIEDNEFKSESGYTSFCPENIIEGAYMKVTKEF